MKKLTTSLLGLALVFAGGPLLADTNSEAQVEVIRDAVVAYPRAALINKVEGDVVVEYTVNRRGRATDIRVVESSSEVFNQAAMDAIANSRFVPASVDGERVEVAGLRKQYSFVLD